MRRNQAQVFIRAARQQANQAQQGPADQGRTGADAGDIAAAGGNAVSGEWVPYGRLDFTRFEDGFRLS